MKERFFYMLDKVQSVQEHALMSIADKDIKNARAWIDQYRFLRSVLQTNFRVHMEENKSISQEEIISSQKRLKLQAEAEVQINKWLNRLDDEVTVDNLFKQDGGIDYLIDTMLPLTWDFEQDLVFLFSIHAKEIANKLKSRGQKNIIIYKGKEGDPKRNLNTFLHSISADLMAMLPPPLHIACIEPMTLAENPNDVEKAHKAITDLCTFIKVNEDTTNKFSLLWAKHKIQNAHNICNALSIRDFAGFFEGRIVIIMCPGPSLILDLHKVKLNRRKYIIMAPAQSCMILSEFGITPDFICVIDPSDLSGTLADVNMAKVTAAILYDTCHPNIFQACSETNLIVLGDKATVYNSGALIEHPAFDFTGMGVLITMFKIARGYEAKTIGLMGVDLSLSSGEYSGDYVNINSSGLPGNIDRENSEDSDVFWSKASGRYHKKIYVESNCGKKIFTKQDYYLFLNDMSGEVMQGSNTEVINFSKHGAKIQGVEYQSFDDFIEKIEKVSITPSLDNSALPFIDKKARAQMLLKLFKRLERSNYKFSKACELAIKELEMQKDLSKSFKKMIHILRGNSVLGHTFKYDLEAFNMQSRLLDLGAPSKAVTLRFLSSMKRNSDGLAKELTISISKLKTVPNKKT